MAKKNRHHKKPVPAEVKRLKRMNRDLKISQRTAGQYKDLSPGRVQALKAQNNKMRMA